MTYHVTTFYVFTPLSQEKVTELATLFTAEGKRLNICGLLLLATEGSNATFAGSEESVKELKSYLQSHLGALTWKDSTCAKKPFKRWKVAIREEIVAIGNPSIVPSGDAGHLSPAEWNQMLQDPDVVVIDTRNDYETAIGKFEGAVDPNLKTFSEFPEYVAASELPKDKKYMLYCTGGIRCEKAVLAMKEQGYENVHQLKGGILQYLKECPEGKFEGECFVFDHRVAVDKNLNPSQKYALCPHCGDPGDLMICCTLCGTERKICVSCEQKQKRFCSKDCAHRTHPKVAA